ncbi:MULTISPECIES: alpha/beta fold hydrolase [unclassified Granulicatella]|uniref:alpha/beta fold hydrolase n=1 Tax=unclassified Granulicatella TaxID=2630493 RepID=UPI0010740132|nr:MULTISPECIES: alpha/beta hydrolase [unclassified Granulicatella]MBF0779861.1 alpha/beta hydrolase [Granulicatella sp. 19428wC4_WM01]TFU96065.1 alpha/beta hydrolase [Granulicatella sp. WM01]
MTKHIVLIHGTWCNGNTWGEFARKLEDYHLTVHTPSLRYHDLSYEECFEKVGTVSLTDYVNDLVDYIGQLDDEPIILGHSLGCLIAQLVAARTRVKGMILMGPAPTPDIFAFYPSMVKSFIKHFLRWGFWKKPMPPYKKPFFTYCMNEQEYEAKEKIFSTLVPESGLVYTQMALPFFDKEKAAYVDYTKITCPVLIITGSNDKMTVSAIARKTAINYPKSLLVSITGADHMYCFGKYMPKTLSIIEHWIGQINR